MPEEIFPSGFKCDCGHEFGFFENTVNELKRMSFEKEVCLSDGGPAPHRVYFLEGAFVRMYCPKTGKTHRRAFRKLSPDKPLLTRRHGQYLAYIYYYTKLNGQPPAEGDMERYFKVTPSAIHQMVIAVEKKGLISRVPGAARSIKLLVPRDQLPDLD